MDRAEHQQRLNQVMRLIQQKVATNQPLSADEISSIFKDESVDAAAIVKEALDLAASRGLTK